MCASAAGAGPAVPKSEDFSMDTDGLDSTDNEVSLCKDLCCKIVF